MFLREVKEGFSYAFGFLPIRSLLLLLGLVSLTGMPYTVLMPVFAENILHGGPRTFGFLLGPQAWGPWWALSILLPERVYWGWADSSLLLWVSLGLDSSLFLSLEFCGFPSY